MITRSMWLDWRKDPVTKFFVDNMLQNRLDRLSDIGDGKAQEKELYLEIGRTQGIKDTIVFAMDGMREVTTLDEETDDQEGSEALS